MDISLVVSSCIPWNIYHFEVDATYHFSDGPLNRIKIFLTESSSTGFSLDLHLYFVGIREAAQKKWLEGGIGPYSLTPFPPCLNGTSRIGTYKISHRPPPSSSNRDKLQFSRDELLNTHWPLILILSGMP